MKLTIRGHHMRPRRYYVDGIQIERYTERIDGDYIILETEESFHPGRHLLRVENDDGQWAEWPFTLEGLSIGRLTRLEHEQPS